MTAAFPQDEHFPETTVGIMFGDAECARGDGVSLVARASGTGRRGQITEIGADNTDGIMHRERQRNRTPTSILVEHELCGG